MDQPHRSEQFDFLQVSQIGQKDPDVVRKEHEKFRKRVSRALKGSFGLAKNKKELEQCIRKAGEQPGGSVKLGELAAAEFNGAAEHLETFKDQRTKGIRGANARFEDSLFAVSRFAAAYSDILEAVSKTSGPYGEIGYQTMTVLLIVFVNKKKHDDKVGEHLDKIRKILPRLETWKGIYRNEQMDTWVSEIYHRVIEFSRSAAEYFCRRWMRVWLAVNPLAMGSKFDDTAQSIYETLAEVNAEANQGLHARSQNIERTVLDLQGTNMALQAKLATLQAKLDEQDKRADEERFRVLEETLSPDAAKHSHSCFNLAVAKDTLKKAFPNVKECSSAISWSMYTLMTPARILLHQNYQAWADSPGSALLFIHGSTRREGRASTVTMPSWLSPAAIHIAEHLSILEELKPVQNRIIYFSCRPNRETSIEQAADVLTMVGLKLLSTRKDISRDGLRDFQRTAPSLSPVSSHASSPPWSQPSFSPRLGSRSKSAPLISAEDDHHDIDAIYDTPSSPKSNLEQPRSFLKEVLEGLTRMEARPMEEKTRRGITAYIILDRLDCVDESVKLQKVLRELVLLMAENDTFCVKIVVVAEARFQENSWKDGLPQNLVDPDQVFEVKMDQRELSLKDMTKQQVLWVDS